MIFNINYHYIKPFIIPDIHLLSRIMISSVFIILTERFTNDLLNFYKCLKVLFTEGRSVDTRRLTGVIKVLILRFNKIDKEYQLCLKRTKKKDLCLSYLSFLTDVICKRLEILTKIWQDFSYNGSLYYICGGHDQIPRQNSLEQSLLCTG